jgi:ADP-ribose pyrophosphatase YjhB (NUDIX family)
MREPDPVKPEEGVVRIRPSARVVLLDERDRVLLLRVEDDSVRPLDGPVLHSYWMTVGGGLEGGETYEDAARREVFEETGIGDFTLGPLLYERFVDLMVRDEPVRARERYFVGWSAGGRVSFDHVDEVERVVLREHRWWTLDEIVNRAPATIFPRSIEELVRNAIGTERTGPDCRS